MSLEIAAVEKYLAKERLPSLSFFFKLVLIYYVLYLFGSLYLDFSAILNMPEEDVFLTQLRVSQGRFIPGVFLFLIYFYCLQVKKTAKQNLAVKLLSVHAFLIYLVICYVFVIKFFDNENRYDFLFIWSFAEITLYSYMAMITGIIISRREISRMFWKRFDILMMIFAFYAFSGTMFQKIFGQAEIVTATAILLGAIAFSMKFAKLTCEYFALKHEEK